MHHIKIKGKLQYFLDLTRSNNMRFTTRITFKEEALRKISVFLMDQRILPINKEDFLTLKS